MERQTDDAPPTARVPAPDRHVTRSRPTLATMSALSTKRTAATPAPEPTESETQTPISQAPTVVTPARAAAPARVSRPVGDTTVIVPGNTTRPIATMTPRRDPTIKPWMRFVAAIVAVVACVVAILGYSVTHPAAVGTAGVTPPPTGRGPTTATIGVIVAAPPPQPVHVTQGAVQQANSAGPGGPVAYGSSSVQPCHDTYMFVPNISQWTVPPGCYALIYKPNTANYVQRPGFGYCNWWVRVTHPNMPDITENTAYPRGTTPVAGAAIYFDPYEQGAGSEGHWAEAVAVSPDHYWVLISEMNFAWRGAGFGLVEYRYIHVSPHVHFLYNV